METQANRDNRLAISYIRYSSLAQGAGDSERRQIEAAERYCKKHDLILTDKFRLHDRGKSAFKGVHRSDTGALGQLEKQVKAGLIPKGTVLIVENLDRLTREDIVTAQLLFLNLINNGLEIVALMDNERKFTKETVNANPMDLVMSIMVLTRGHEESATKKKRSLSIWYVKKTEAKQGNPVKMALHGWLRMKDGKYELIPDKAETIRRIFKLYLSGYGASTIAEMLRKDKTPITTREQKKTGKWLFSTVLRIIKCKAVTGGYNGVVPEVPDYFPRVISDIDYYAAQSMRKERVTYKGQRSLNPFVFSHILKCSKCGQSMTRTVQGAYTYLRCMGYNAGKCDSSYMEYKNTEKALLDVISSLDESVTKLNDSEAFESQIEIKALEGSLNEIDERIKTSSAILAENFTQAGNQIIQDYETKRAGIVKEIEAKKIIVGMSGHKKEWPKIIASLKTEIKNIDAELMSFATLHNLPLPTPSFQTNDPFAEGFDPDEPGEYVKDNKPDIIGIRESLRAYIEQIKIDIKEKQACIILRNGKRISVWFRASHTYPRRYSYKTADTDWQEISTL